jgi:transposase
VLADRRAVRGSASNALKTDKVDARTLARLLAGGLLPEVWLPDERTRRLHRLVSQRAQLVRQRTRPKNQVHAAPIRNLRPRQPMRDLFGVAGRRWLAAQTLPTDEQETVVSRLREIAFLAGEIGQLEQTMAFEVLACPQMRRLLTLPGISSVAACTLIAAIGDIEGWFEGGDAWRRLDLERGEDGALGVGRLRDLLDGAGGAFDRDEVQPLQLDCT